MRRLWNEFKGFAMSGNMLDLALGFIIGAAFAKIIESLARNVLMQGVAAVFGKQDFTGLVLTVNRAEIRYGDFLTDLVNFLLLAALLFIVVKFIVFIGVGRGRNFGTQQCPYCYEYVAPEAMICKWCRRQLVDELPELDDARTQLEDRYKRKLNLPLTVPIPIPGRRKASESKGADG